MIPKTYWELVLAIIAIMWTGRVLQILCFRYGF